MQHDFPDTVLTSDIAEIQVESVFLISPFVLRDDESGRPLQVPLLTNKSDYQDNPDQPTRYNQSEANIWQYASTISMYGNVPMYCPSITNIDRRVS